MPPRSTTARRADPEPEAQPAPPPSSAELRADLDALDAGRAADAARLADLEAGRAAALLTGDDAQAEAHEADTARARRAVERADLMRPGFAEVIAAAQRREAAEAKARVQEAARAEVAAILARLDAEYVEPAGRIAAFLADWKRIADIARDAEIDGPDEAVRKRGPAVVRPAEREEYRVFIDENGQESDRPYPIGSHAIDDLGRPLDGYGRPLPPRREVRRFRNRPAVHDTGKALTPLAEAVALPPPRMEAPAPWSFDERYPVAPEPPRRGLRPYFGPAPDVLRRL